MIRHHLLFVFFHSQSPIRTINGPLILWIIINTFCALSQEFNGGRKFSREINRKRTIKILESTIIIKLIAKSQLEATPNYNQSRIKRRIAHEIDSLDGPPTSTFHSPCLPLYFIILMIIKNLFMFKKKASKNYTKSRFAICAVLC